MGDGIGDFAFWIAMGGLFLGITCGPIGRGLGRWIEAKARARGLTPDVEDRLAEVDRLQQRLAETEERLDFTERVLAQHRIARTDEADTPPEAVPVAQ
jgi:hypothetical protein